MTCGGVSSAEVVVMSSKDLGSVAGSRVLWADVSGGRSIVSP